MEMICLFNKLYFPYLTQILKQLMLNYTASDLLIRFELISFCNAIKTLHLHILISSQS